MPVVRTSRILVASDSGQKVFRSLVECPPEVRHQLREALTGENRQRIRVRDHYSMDAIRGRSLAMRSLLFVVPKRTRTASTRRPAARRRSIAFKRWEFAVGASLLALAALAALLSWAISGG